MHALWLHHSLKAVVPGGVIENPASMKATAADMHEGLMCAREPVKYAVG